MNTFLKVLGLLLALTAGVAWWGFITFCGVHPHGFC
jgi:hypothetical protein